MSGVGAQASDWHVYEPRLGHGLAHDPFNAIVAPRPIGWIATHDGQGHHNLAPYSFCNAFNYVPPIVGFASLGRKDTLRNIERTGEFVWNVVSEPLAQAMNTSCAAVPPEVDEFALASLDWLPARHVQARRVALSPAQFECRVTQIVPLQTAQGDTLPTWLVLGEVVCVHLHRSTLADGRFHTLSAQPVLRGGGGGDYFTLSPGGHFHMSRPGST
ncbi:flavin reductase family protein [Aquabacterium lacunae]|uniref:Flavin reductase family protein n=1 Tax=Aquabacterium lacunae TaxID=2528630 RepID=A0A4Q9GYN1_9BURK|nr:flavin reductase family protein [Aquabacterium lacunae]TBO31154.1 flavin reductase family protein [Aquabacterium lacunae]